MLGARILPFFQQDKLAVDSDEDTAAHSETIHLVELPRPSPYDVFSRTPQGVKYLNSPQLNIHKDYLDNQSFSKALKQAEFYINESIEIPVRNLKYHRLHKALNQGLLSKKVYAAIGLKQPIQITHAGNTFPVATLDTRVYLPESVCCDLERKYVGKYPDDATLKLSVAGPAAIFGGYSEGYFMKFYCLDYYLEIYAERYTIDVVM